jgi:hypothetical protein
MKKLILSFLLAASSSVAFAQLPAIGIKGGLNAAGINASGTQNNVVEGTNISASSNTVTSFNFGVFVDIKLGHFSLQPAVNFTGKGGTFNGFTGTLPNGSKTEVNSKYNLYYVQVPLNIVYHVPLVIGEFYVGAGPYVSMGVYGKQKLIANNSQSGAFSSSKKIDFGDNGDIKSNDSGANTIAGIKLKGGLLINLNYDLGLANILPDADGRKFKTRVFGASVGFVF